MSWRSFPARALALLSRGGAVLDRVAKDTAQTSTLLKDSAKRDDGVHEELRRTRQELAELRREVRTRLLQNTLTVARAARALEHAPGAAPSASAGDAGRLSTHEVPLDAPDASTASWATMDGRAPDPEGREWLTLSECPACGSPEHTVVSPWNKLVLIDRIPDRAAARYDYSLCHACGLLFAARRPCGERYRFLLAQFEDVTAKRDGAAITNVVLNPRPLDDEDRAELRRLASRGVFVSDHLRVSRKEHLPALLRDRFENSLHTDVIGALLAPRGGRVLEVRSRVGSILDGLRAAWGAEVFAMPIWESQQQLLRDVYGIETSELIDFDRFSIPFEGEFDLIICNHLITHAVRLGEFLAEVRRKLKPGGHIYLHNEPDDAEFLAGTQSMLATLNPLHLQAFDDLSLVRVLAANGFETMFLKHQRNETLFCMARMQEPTRVAMTEDERTARLGAYRRAFDRAVLKADEPVRARLAAEWPDVVADAVASGAAEFDERGRLRIVVP
jgi:SAM-dependent methyltransferase